MSEMYDVAIVGAGPGGSAAAHYLASGTNTLLAQCIYPIGQSRQNP